MRARVVVLGIAQDGGIPQAGCKRPCCAKAWNDPRQRRYVSSLAIIDAHSKQRWLIDCTPDFKEQLHYLDRIAPSENGAVCSGIFLTHAHIGHYCGLIHLGREAIGARKIPVHAMPRMAKFLKTNAPWEQLVTLGNIRLVPMRKKIRLAPQLTLRPIRVPHRSEYSEAVGFVIEGAKTRVLYIPDIDRWELLPSIRDEVQQADIALLDGTFFSDQELPPRRRKEVPHPPISDSLRFFRSNEARGAIRFIHLNHTNPALNRDSASRKFLEREGFGVAEQFETILL